MRGVVFDGTDYAVTNELSVRDPEAGEVIVSIQSAGLCHSDLSVITGTIPFPVPVVLGHEGAGIVTAVGSSVTTVKEGDHVILSTLGNCGACAYCDQGRPTMCRDTFGKRPQPFTYQGAPAYNFANASCFSEQTVVKANQCIPIPDDVPFAAASLVGCGVLTGIGAVLQRARVPEGATAAVIGVGGIGLNVIQGLRLAGASRIIAIDTNLRKEPLAKEFGATEFLSDVKAVKDLLPAGVDFAFECVGHTALIRAAMEMLDWSGTAVLLGVPEATAEASFNVASMYLDKTIMGCRYGASQPQRDVRRYIDLYRKGDLLLDQLVTREYKLDEIKTAVHDMESGELARGVLNLV